MKVRQIEFDDAGNIIQQQTEENEVQTEEIVEVDEQTEDSTDTGDEQESDGEELNEESNESLQQEDEGSGLLEEEASDDNLEQQVVVVDESSVLEYLKENYNFNQDSLDSLKEDKKELPESIQKLIDYQNETGRSIEDYVYLNKDWTAVPDETLIRDYLKYKKPHLDDSEIEFEIKRRFSYDEDIDEENDVYAKKIAKKDFIYEAKGFFNKMKESYSAPLESRNAEIPKEYKEAYELVTKYKSEQEKTDGLNKEKYKAFVKQTEEYFGDKFEGFKFKIDEDNTQVYNPKDVGSVKNIQSDVNNFFSEFLDENGMVKNPEQYHKALFMALNAEEMAKFFYEQGVSDGVENIDKESKNIDMDVRKVLEENKNTGTKIRTFSGDTITEFKIRRKK